MSTHFKKGWALALGLTGVAVALGAAWSFHAIGAEKAQQAQKPHGFPPAAIEASPVMVRPVSDVVQAVGSLRANEAVTIRPEVADTITQILFKEGAKVKENQVLVRLDDAPVLAELAQANASLELSKRSFQRAQELFKRNAASSSARDQARAKLDSDKAQVQLIKTKIDTTVLRAPFAGTIGLRKVSVGAYVSPGQDIVDLVNDDPIKVDFSIPERDIRAVKVGQHLDIKVDAFPGESFSGTVYAIAPQVDAQDRSLALRARIPNADGKLRPGLFARVSLIVETRPHAIVVPEQAVFAQGEGWFVYTVVGGKAKLVRIETGVRRDGWVEITKGLQPGDEVVTAGHIKLRPGAPVRIVKPQSPGKS